MPFRYILIKILLILHPIVHLLHTCILFSHICTSMHTQCHAGQHRWSEVVALLQATPSGWLNEAVFGPLNCTLLMAVVCQFYCAFGLLSYRWRSLILLMTCRGIFGMRLIFASPVVAQRDQTHNHHLYSGLRFRSETAYSVMIFIQNISRTFAIQIS